MKNGKYITSQEFAADVQLMLSNCFKYNEAEDEPVVKMARKLEKFFEKRMTTAPPDYPAKPAAEPVQFNDDSFTASLLEEGASVPEESELQKALRLLEENVSFVMFHF